MGWLGDRRVVRKAKPNQSQKPAGVKELSQEIMDRIASSTLKNKTILEINYSVYVLIINSTKWV